MFTIMKWPDDSSTEHYATSWVLAKNMTSNDNGQILVNDKPVEVTEDAKIIYDGKTYDPNNSKDDLSTLRSLGFVDMVIKSETDVIAWDPNYDVPVGVVWYISALRHLRDKNTKEDLNNDIWLPVDPAINKNSFKNEFFSTKLEISEPSILNMDYVPGKSITLTLPEPKSNVTYLNTFIVIKDTAGKTILTKIINIKDNKNQITIDSTKDNVDFDNYDVITIKLWHVANHSTISPEYKETFLLKQVYFNIEGRKNDIDPYSVNELAVITKSTTSVEVINAVVEDSGEKVLANCAIVDGKYIKIPNNVLEFNDAYTVALDLLITYDNGKKDTIKYYVPITTRIYSEEKTVIDKDYMYKNVLNVINNYDYEKAVFTIDKDISINSEEFFTYLTPMFDKENKDISFYIFGRNNNIFSRFKSKILDVDTESTIRLLDKNIGYLTTFEKDNNVNKMLIDIFKYDSYEDELTIINKNNPDLLNNHPVMRKVIELSKGYYLAGISSSNAKVLNIYAFDPALNKLTLVTSKTFANNIEDISFVEWGEDLGLIYVKSENEIRFQIFSSITSNILESMAIPTEYRNQIVVLERLKNGNIIGFKLQTSDKPLDYFIIDINTQEIKQFTNSYKGNGTLVNINNLINGNIILYLAEDNNITIYEYE